MSRPASLRPLVLALALAATALPACGASIRALYESDVRFEHCMALDAVPETKATLQRACWEEWLSFYTFGQTRDRIDYARHRARELGVASDFVDAPEPPRAAGAAAADPTSAFAPPPSMLVSADAGAPDASPAVDDRAAALARCAADCDQGLETCRTTCKRTPPCEQACAARRKRCAARCDLRAAQGSR